MTGVLEELIAIRDQQAKRLIANTTLSPLTDTESVKRLVFLTVERELIKAAVREFKEMK